MDNIEKDIPKWKERNLLEKVFSIINLVLSAIILIFVILQLLNVIDYYISIFKEKTK